MDRRDFLRRALVVFTLGPLTLLLIYLGGWFYFLAFGALLIIATIEIAHLFEKLGAHAPLGLIIPLSVALWFFPEPVQQMLLGKVISEYNLVSPVLLVSLFAALFFGLWLYERRQEVNAPKSWMVTVGIIMLMGWLGSHFFRVRGLPENAAAWTTLAMLGTWIADSGAYVFGKTMGKHKLSPRLSPNKTIEGYIGGIIFGTGFTVIIGLFFELPIMLTVILGLLVSTVSPAGDLGISLLKRSADVKDSGNLLPGHGGALDRIDSLIWSAAFAYYLILFAG